MINDSNIVPKSIWGLSASLACVGAGQSTIFILVPMEVRSLGFNEFQVGIIFSISALAWIFFSPFWGRLSDKIGRSKIFMTGIIGFALSMILFGAVITYAKSYLIPLSILFFLLVLTRLINGLLGSAVRPASGGRIADITSRENRTSGFARFDAGWQFGVIVGPVIVGLLLLISDNNLFIPFLFIAIIGIITGFINYSFLKKDDVINTKTTILPPLSFFDERVWPSLLVAGFTGISNACLVVTSSLFVNDVILKLNESIYSFVAIGFSIVAFSGLVTQLFIVDRFKINPIFLVKLGVGLMIFSFFCLSISSTITAFYLSLIFYGIGGGLARPGNITVLSLSVNKDEQGSATGLLGMIFPVGHLITPFSIMPLYMINPSYPYLIICLIGLCLIFYMIYNQKLFFKFINAQGS